MGTIENTLDINMGTIEIKQKYKTKSILSIFAWYAKMKKIDQHKCEEISKLTENFTEALVERDKFEENFQIPFDLLSNENQVKVTELKIALLLLSKDEQGARIEVFKSLTPDPEELFNYFRFKYSLIYTRIPEYLIKIKLIDPIEGNNYIKRKVQNIQKVSNLKYTKYTTSSCNVLKLTLLRT